MTPPDVVLAFDLMRLNPNGIYWTNIFDHPGLFISDTGLVASIRKKGPPRLLKGSPCGIGYLTAGNPKRGDRFYIHQMVCETFRGPRPAGMVARHLDGNLLNNDCGNLMWGTPTENMDDMRRHGRTVAGARNPNVKLTREQVAQMRAQRASHGTYYRDLAKQFGVTTMTAHRAVRGVSWK